MALIVFNLNKLLAMKVFTFSYADWKKISNTMKRLSGAEKELNEFH